MTTQVLDQPTLNRTMLARQGLLRRHRGSVADVLERVGGLQTQYAPSGYIGLWSRMESVARADVTDALEARQLVQATLIRATIHMVSARDYRLFTAGVRRSRLDWWRRTTRKESQNIDVEAAAALVRSELATGPRRQREIVAALEDAGFPRLAWAAAGLILDLVRVPPSGTWERRRADLYSLADDWVGPPDATEEEGLAHLVARYLGGYGPAPLGDIANWAGVPITTLRPVIESMDLRRLHDEAGHELLDLPAAPLVGPEADAPVRLLPTWDSILLVHARRTGVLPEAYRPLIFNTKNPHSMQTILVDGAVAGTWRVTNHGTVAPDFFEPLSARVQQQVRNEAERLEIFVG